MRSTIAASAMLGALLAATPTFAAPDPVADIRAADRAWSAAFESGNLEAAVAAVDPEAAVLAPNVPIAADPAAIRTLLTGFLAIPDVHIGWRSERAAVAASGEIGYSSGRYTMDFTGSDGAKVHDVGKYLTVWKKQPDGSWKVLLDIFNTDLPPK